MIHFFCFIPPSLGAKYEFWYMENGLLDLAPPAFLSSGEDIINRNLFHLDAAVL